MKRPFIEFLNSDYSQQEWFWTRLMTGIVAAIQLLIPLVRFDDAPFPEGICLLIPCGLIGIGAVKSLMIALAVIAPLWYIIRPSGYSIALVSAISILALTIERANGLHHRNELVSMVFIVQGLAYLFAKNKSSSTENEECEVVFQRAIRYSIQIVAAGYFASGLTKLGTAGIDWAIDSPYISLQMIKTYTTQALSHGNWDLIGIGEEKAAWVLAHQNLVRLMFGAALLTELLAFLSAFGRKIAFFYGIALFGMHVLIYAFTTVVVWAFVLMLLIYTLRTPGLILWLLHRLKPKNESTA